MDEQNTTPIVNVAVAGATGNIGAAVVQALLDCGKFSVTLLSRSDRQDAPVNAKVAIVRYDQPASLVSALSGQDALVCALSRNAVPYQIALIDAAVEAGVKRIIPSEFGANLSNQNSRRLANYRQKVLVEDHLVQKSEQSGLTYTFIYTMGLMDWSIRAGVLLDFRNLQIYLYNGGERPVSMATIPAAAEAVVGVLSKLEQTRKEFLRGLMEELRGH